ncbi:MAG: hypothetical protein AAES65_07015 [Candidatus Thiodiazotropha sp. (ex. Lucinoma kazani)]
MIWLAAYYSRLGFKEFPISSPQTPIRITIVHPRDIQTDTPRNRSVIPTYPIADNESKTRAPQTQVYDNRTDTNTLPTPKPEDKIDSELTKPEAITGTISTRPVSVTQIITTATDIAHEIAGDNTSEVVKETSSVSTKLDRALNKLQQTPGVYSLSDGTIRIVTEFGTTYCIQPIDDWRINGPEDDMRVSMYCK